MDLSLYELLKHCVEKNASDLHLKVGYLPAVRIDGSISNLPIGRVGKREFEKIIETITTGAQRERFDADHDLDFSYAVEGVCRFRVNLYRDVGGVGAVFRTIPYRVMSFEEIGLPPAAQKLIEQPNGLILVTGPTGAGKTSTLAAYINVINRSARRHIVTLEDPIEFQFDDHKSIINQRQIGIDCVSFHEGLRTVLRQDPDIVVVGEMRDPRTIGLTLTAAETGKLVLATLHTTSAVTTAERIVNVFPENQQQQVLHQLSMVLRGVVSQTLLQKKGGGRVAAFEILLNTSAVRAMIAEGRIHLLASFLETGTESGMMTLEQSMAALVKSGQVDREEALSACSNPVALRKLLQGV